MAPKKTVYVCMSANLVHPGHLSVIKKDRVLGESTIQHLTAEPIASYKRLLIWLFISAGK